MVNTIFIIFLLTSLIVTSVLGAYTLLRCENRNGAPFIAVLASAFLYTLGYLLQTISGDAERASLAFIVTFTGASYLAPAYLYFVAEYCETRIPRMCASVLIGLPFIYIILVATTDMHGLIFASYSYVTDKPVHFLDIVPGPFYYILHAYTLVSVVVMAVLIARRFQVKIAKYRTNLVLLLAGAVFFMLMNALFLLKFSPYGINPVHTFTTILVLMLYFCIMRCNLMDIMPFVSEKVLSSVRDALIIVDPNNLFLRANDAAYSLFPRLRGFEKGVPLSQLVEWPGELLPGEELVCGDTITFCLPENRYYTATIDGIVEKRGAVQGYIIIIQDITESVMLTKKLEEFAYTDVLTGTNNRRHFMNLALAQVERVRRSNSEAFIVLFDVDHFKAVNDTHGHIIGDRVLKCIADRVKEAIRPYDLFGRYGGEEFILFVADISEEDITCYTERIRMAINSAPITYEGMELTVTASFGIARLVTEEGLNAAIKLADAALYEAKGSGRNRTVLYTFSAYDDALAGR
jgi:diguanylate cyclase (GGDEF)-like protein